MAQVFFKRIGSFFQEAYFHQNLILIMCSLLYPWSPTFALSACRINDCLKPSSHLKAVHWIRGSNKKAPWGSLAMLFRESVKVPHKNICHPERSLGPTFFSDEVAWIFLGHPKFFRKKHRLAVAPLLSPGYSTSLSFTESSDLAKGIQ